MRRAKKVVLGVGVAVVLAAWAITPTQRTWQEGNVRMTRSSSVRFLRPSGWRFGSYEKVGCGVTAASSEMHVPLGFVEVIDTRVMTVFPAPP